MPQLHPLESRTLLAGSPLATASALSMAFAPNGTLHVAFYDATQHLRYAKRAADGTWGAAITIDAHPLAGQSLALALDATDRPAIAYYDATTRDLKYAQFTRKNAWAV